MLQILMNALLRMHATITVVIQWVPTHVHVEMGSLSFLEVQRLVKECIYTKHVTGL